jgi:hypothetical protein
MRICENFESPVTLFSLAWLDAANGLPVALRLHDKAHPTLAHTSWSAKETDFRTILTHNKTVLFKTHSMHVHTTVSHKW